MYQSTAIKGEIWNAVVVEEVGDVVENDRTVEIELLGTTRAPAKSSIVKQFVQASKWRKREKRECVRLEVLALEGAG